VNELLRHAPACGGRLRFLAERELLLARHADVAEVGALLPDRSSVATIIRSYSIDACSQSAAPACRGTPGRRPVEDRHRLHAGFLQREIGELGRLAAAVNRARACRAAAQSLHRLAQVLRTSP
jgi:hypothetical protein